MPIACKNLNPDFPLELSLGVGAVGGPLQYKSATPLSPKQYITTYLKGHSDR
jgi:hypothetical protein